MPNWYNIVLIYLYSLGMWNTKLKIEIYVIEIGDT